MLDMFPITNVSQNQTAMQGKTTIDLNLQELLADSAMDLMGAA